MLSHYEAAELEYGKAQTKKPASCCHIDGIGILGGIVASREAMKLTGNGEQTGFTTGATRSTDVGKVDYEGFLNPEVLAIFGEYMHRHRVQRDGQVRASDNWQQGIPVYRYVKSLIRHMFEFWRMWRGVSVTNTDNGQAFTLREVLSAILFNVMGIIYELERSNRCKPWEHPKLDDSFVYTARREALEKQ